MIVFDHQGNFQKEFPHKHYTFDFTYKDDNYLIYNINVPGYDNFMTFDSTYKNIASFSPVRYNPFVMPLTGRDYLLTDGENEYFTFPYSDTIYKLKDTIVTPYFSYGFGDKILTDFISFYNGISDKELEEYSYSYMDLITDDFIVSSLVIDYKNSLSIFNRSSNKSVLIDSLTNGPDLINGATLSYVSSDGLFYWLYNRHRKIDSIDDILKDQKLNDNSLIIKCSLNKDFL